jgi:hypothetical protein
MKRELTTFDLLFRNTLFLFALRLLWHSYVGLVMCLLFWSYSKCGDPLFMRGLSLRRRALHAIGFVGGSLNAIATIANRGHMPVLGKTVKDLGEGSVWIPLTAQTHFAALCDAYRFGAGMISIGDMFILVCLCGFLLNWTLEKVGAFEATVSGERLPGMGGVGFWI